MRYTVAEFRKNIREAFNAVERGEDVYITRHNKTFAIIKSPVSFLSTGEASISIKPDIVRESTPTGPNPFEKINSGATPQDLTEKPCCQKQKPCQHWQWNSDRAIWINSLSGRERGAE